MKAKALSTFRTQLWPTDEGTVVVCGGQIIDADPQHVADLARLGLVAIIEEKVVAPVKVAPSEQAANVKPAKAPSYKRKGRK